MGCLRAPVPQFDRTMLRICSAPQLGPFVGASLNGPSNNARRRAARPHLLSSTVPEPRHKSRAGHPIPDMQEEISSVISLQAHGRRPASRRGRDRLPDRRHPLTNTLSRPERMEKRANLEGASYCGMRHELRPQFACAVFQLRLAVSSLYNSQM